MSKRSILLIAAVVVVLALPWSVPAVRAVRQSQFDSVRALVETRGGSLDIDLVDGNYFLQLQGAAATDETLRELVPALERLPTGFTWIGPGEERLFWVSLDGDKVSDGGIATLCELRLAALALQGGEVSDASAERLSKVTEFHSLALDRTRISSSAKSLMRRKPCELIVADDAE